MAKAKQVKSVGVIDRISSLPEPVLCHILSFLPAKDAVRTSLLSPRWRYLFTSMSTLDFDDCLSGVPSKYYNNFKDFVDGLIVNPKLQQQQQLSLECFRANDIWVNWSYPWVGDRPWADDYQRLCDWLCAILRRGVKRIYIDLSNPFLSVEDILILLPPLLFTCPSLVILELSIYCEINIPINVCLPNLKTLRLKGLAFFDVSSIHRLISSCHVLEDLAFDGCEFGYITVLNIGGDTNFPTNFCLPNLKTLHLNYIDFSDSSAFKLISSCPVLEELVMRVVASLENITEFYISNLSLKRLVLDLYMVGYSHRDFNYAFVMNAPNLVYFEYSDLIAESYCLSTMNSLEQADIKVHQLVREEAAYDVNCERGATNLLQAICNVKSLYLSIQQAETLIRMPCKPPFVFDNLVELKFNNEGGDWQGTWVIEFLDCAPNLNTLQLSLEYGAEGSKPLPEKAPSCLLFHLKEIKVFEFVGKGPLFEMVCYFLNHGRYLEKLIIAMHHLIREEDKSSISEKLRKLPKKSKKCQVVAL